jgi:hypothetical protein
MYKYRVFLLAQTFFCLLTLLNICIFLKKRGMIVTLPGMADGIDSPEEIGAAAMRRKVHGFFYAPLFMVGEVSGGREACRFQFPVYQPDKSSAALVLITPDGGQSPYRSMTMSDSIIEQSNPVKTALYRHFDADNRLLYVGISISSIHRFKDHKITSEWAFMSVRIEMQWFDSREEAVEAERHAITNEHPRFNKVHSLINQNNKHEEKPAGLPFQRLNINKYDILHKTNSLLAQAYLIECGITPVYIQKQLSCLGSSAPIVQGIGKDESIESLIARFIDDWQTQVIAAPFMPCLGTQAMRLLHIWMEKNAIDIDTSDNRLAPVMYRHHAVFAKRLRISPDKYNSTRRILMIKGETLPIDMPMCVWMAENVDRMESILKNLEAT